MRHDLKSIEMFLIHLCFLVLAIVSYLVHVIIYVGLEHSLLNFRVSEIYIGLNDKNRLVQFVENKKLFFLCILYIVYMQVKG